MSEFQELKYKVPEDKNSYAYRLAQRYADQYKDWRWGQCIFNAYYTVFPEITNQIRGTDDNCFCVDAKVSAFLNHFVIEPVGDFQEKV